MIISELGIIAFLLAFFFIIPFFVMKLGAPQGLRLPDKFSCPRCKDKLGGPLFTWFDDGSCGWTYQCGTCPYKKNAF